MTTTDKAVKWTSVLCNLGAVIVCLIGALLSDEPLSTKIALWVVIVVCAWTATKRTCELLNRRP